MATTIRGGGVGKDKRITSPSSSSIKRSPKPSSSSSPSATKTTSTSGSKSTPNHLRPQVISSKDEPTKVLKKSVLDNKSVLKPTLDRRRSFDRPPSSSQVQRTVHNGPATRDVKTSRSSSFSHRSTTAPLAPSSSRRAPTAPSVASRKVSVKGDSPVSKPGGVRRTTLSNNTVKESTKGRSLTRKGRERSVDYETQSDSYLMNEDHVLGNISSELESLPEISDMNETASDLGDPTNGELEINQQTVEQADHTDIDTEDEHHQEDDELVVNGQIADAVQESISHVQEDQTAGKHPDEDIQVTVEEVDSEKQDHANNEHEESNVELAETLMEDKKEEEPIKEEGDKVVEEAGVNKEQETESKSTSAASFTVVTPPVRSQPAWKKENQAYNDVIEETATKLRLKKNKVLALAGAFETVISLQDTNNKN